MVTASQRLQNTWKVLAGTDTLLTHPSRGDAQSRASILQAFLRTDQDISLRPWGRRCLADHHLRTWCPPNEPPRASSGSGESWFEPRRGVDRLELRARLVYDDRHMSPAHAWRTATSRKAVCH